MFARMLHWVSTSLRSGFHDAWTTVNQLDTQEWLLLLAVTTGIGFLCMRGFGSRNSY